MTIATTAPHRHRPLDFGVRYLKTEQPLAPFAERLLHWAQTAPERTLMAQRVKNADGSKGDWRRISYAEALGSARSIGQDFAKLRHVVDTLTPGLVFASDAGRYGRAMLATLDDDVEIAIATGAMPGRATTAFADLLATTATAAVDAAMQATGPGTIAKFLFTSGSTKLPKSVINTHGMWCANQQQMLQRWPRHGQRRADAQACREWSAMLKYDTKVWGAAVGYDEIHGRMPASAADVVLAAGLTSISKSDGRLMLNGYVNLAGAKLGAGVIRRSNDGSATRPKSDLWYIGAAYPLTSAWTIDGTLAKLNYRNFDNANSTLLALRSLYKLSKRTTLYAQIGAIRNDSLDNLSVSGGAPGSNPALGGSQTGTMVGINHTF